MSKSTKELTNVGDVVKYDSGHFPIYSKVVKKNPKTVVLEDGAKIRYEKIVGWA